MTAQLTILSLLLSLTLVPARGSEQVSSTRSVRETSGNVTSTTPTAWKPHVVRQLNGRDKPTQVPARFQIMTERWNRVVAVPYIVYMPGEDRLLMLVSCDYPHQAMVLFSTDRGATWSEPRYVQSDAQDKPGNLSAMATGLTYLGGGKTMLHMGDRHWFSADCGRTWGNALIVPPASNGRPWIEWDPLLVDRDPATGKVTRLMSCCSDNLQPDGHFQGYVRFSNNEGRAWSGEIKVPEWYAVNEVAFARARNGDIVAACRTDNPERFKKEIDHYGGLGVSVSRDDGRTWSKLSMLYEWGRHHPSLLQMPNGHLVMTYVVRKGYVDTKDGLPQFGIEAVISRDNGQTWDLDHRYLLHCWPGNRKVRERWWPSSQATSSVLLPDGWILTAFGTGYRSQVGPGGTSAPRDVGLVQWRPNTAPTNSDHAISDAPFDSELRNVFDPSL